MAVDEAGMQHIREQMMHNDYVNRYGDGSTARLYWTVFAWFGVKLTSQQTWDLLQSLQDDSEAKR